MRSAAVIAVVVGLLLPRAAWAEPTFTLNRYAVAEHPRDGFLVRRPLSLSHLQLGAQLHVDHALRPLVLERNLDDDAPLPLVRHQATAHASVALGLWEHLTVHAQMPVDLALSGRELPGQPRASGFGSGDLRLGARGVLGGGPARAGAAFRLWLSLPTGAGAGDAPAVTGEDGVGMLGEFVGELPMGPVSLTGNFGLRLRPDAPIGGTRIHDELTYGAGITVRALPSLLWAYLELSGAAVLEDATNEATSPLEAALGAKLLLAGRFTVGLSGGAGIVSAVGSPTLRTVLAIGYQTPARRTLDTASASPSPQQAPRAEQAPDSPPDRQAGAEALDPGPAQTRGEDGAGPAAVAGDAAPGDRDGDGLLDRDDQCPWVPGDSGRMGCGRAIAFEPETGHLRFDGGLRFATGQARPRGGSERMLDELAAMLRAYPGGSFRIDAHSRNEGTPASALALSAARAEALRADLAERGVDSAGVEWRACGARHLLSTARGGRARRNDRAEVWLVSPAPPTDAPATAGCEIVE